MKNKAIISVILSLAMTMSLASCGGAKGDAPAAQEEKQETAEAAEAEAAETETAEAEAPEAEAPEAEAEVTVPEPAEVSETEYETFTNDGMVLRVPVALVEKVTVETPDPSDKGVLFSVSETASIDAAKATGQNSDGAGWLFAIGRVSEKVGQEYVDNDIPGVTFFASDAEGNAYVYYHPTDVRIVRENNDDIFNELHVWERLNVWSETMQGDFIADNEGLKADYRVPAMDLDMLCDIFFTRIEPLHAESIASSPQAAEAVSAILQIAATCHLDLFNADQIKDMREAMLGRWEGFSDTERANFDGNLMEFAALVNNCVTDWESCRGPFEEAHADKMVDILVHSRSAINAWNVLFANTLTMGNSDGE